MASRWQEVAQHHFPGEQLDFPADVYQRAAREAAELTIAVTVDLATGVTPETSEPIFDMVDAADAIRREACDAAAYKIGYKAQLADAEVGGYDHLDQLVKVIIQGRRQDA